MILKESEFKKHIKSKEFSNVYVIYGEEKFLVKVYSNQLIKSMMGENPPEFNFHNFDNNSELNDIAVACDVMPFMSEYNCVVITDFNVDALNKDDLDKLKEIIKNLSPSTKLIFTFPTLCNSGKQGNKDLKKANFKSILRLADKNGVVVEYPKYDSHATSKELVRAATKRGCSLTLANAGKIVDFVGTDLTALQNEMDKLCAYADGKEITIEMINRLVHINLETKVYFISNYIIKNDLNKAYKELDILFYQKTEPISIVSTIASAYMDLYRARVAGESGVPVTIVAQDFNYGNRAFVLNNSARDGRYISTPAIRKSIDEILNTDFKLKSSATDGRVLVEELIAKLSLIAKEINYAKN